MMTMKTPLLLALLCVLLTGCGQDQYFLERQYYRVQEQARDILKNPEATPPAELARAVAALEVFLTKYPKTNVAVDAQFTIARLYVVTKEYDQAHDQLKRIQKVFKDSDVIMAEAAFTNGAVYEEEKKWDLAVEQYQQVTKYYALTPRGIQTPFFIAMRYKDKLQPDKMIIALRDAIDHYKSLVVKFQGSPLSLKCKMMIVQCYLELKEPENAIGVLQASIEEFKGKIPVEGMMLDIAGIYYGQMKDTAKAIEVLNKVVTDFPKSEASKVAQSMIDKIKATKDKEAKK